MNITTEIAPIINLEGKDFNNYNEMIDHVEKCMVDHFDSIALPVAHTITPGLYTREMYAPTGTLVTSKVHITDHQFIISKGVIWILDDFSKQWNRFEAPYRGITRKGTRRVGYVEEDVIWTTMHATPLVEDKEYTQDEFIKLVEDIEDSIIDKRDNKLLNT